MTYLCWSALNGDIDHAEFIYWDKHQLGIPPSIVNIVGKCLEREMIEPIRNSTFHWDRYPNLRERKGPNITKFFSEGIELILIKILMKNNEFRNSYDWS